MAILEKLEAKTALSNVVFYLDSYASCMNQEEIKDFTCPLHNRYFNKQDWDYSIKILNFFKLCNEDIFEITQAYDFFEIWSLSEIIQVLQHFLKKLTQYAFERESMNLLQNPNFNLVVIEGLRLCLDSANYVLS